MKVLAVVDNDLYLRNFVLSGAFDETFKNFDSILAISNAVEKLKPLISKKFKIKEYTRNEKNKSKVQVFNQISMRHLKHKSTTFQSKTQNYSPLLKEKILFNFFALPFIYNLAKFIIQKQFLINPKLEKIIKKFNPDIVLFPTSGYEATGYELIKLSKKYYFKTFFLTNGWDNLSSKGVLLFKPDFIGVWGQQALYHAVKIQNMKKENCILTGCARYENYFDQTKGNTKIFPFNYILFAGSTTAADEITPLQILETALDRPKYKNIKIVYRPHPMRAPRKGFDLFEQEKYKHIIIDPQVAPDYYRDKKEKTESGAAQNFPDLEYYPSLLKNCLFLISPLSSLIIESAIYNVPSLILAHQDPDNPIPASEQVKWEHFKGAKNIDGWYIAHDLKQMVNLFNKLLKKTINKNLHKSGNNLSKSIKKYLYFDNRSYSKRLSDYLEQIITK